MKIIAIIIIIIVIIIISALLIYIFTRKSKKEEIYKITGGEGPLVEMFHQNEKQKQSRILSFSEQAIQEIPGDNDVEILSIDVRDLKSIQGLTLGKLKEYATAYMDRISFIVPSIIFPKYFSDSLLDGISIMINNARISQIMTLNEFSSLNLIYPDLENSNLAACDMFIAKYKTNIDKISNEQSFNNFIEQIKNKPSAEDLKLIKTITIGNKPRINTLGFINHIFKTESGNNDKVFLVRNPDLDSNMIHIKSSANKYSMLKNQKFIFLEFSYTTFEKNLIFRLFDEIHGITQETINYIIGMDDENYVNELIDRIILNSYSLNRDLDEFRKTSIKKSQITENIANVINRIEILIPIIDELGNVNDKFINEYKRSLDIKVIDEKIVINPNSFNNIEKHINIRSITNGLKHKLDEINEILVEIQFGQDKSAEIINNHKIISVNFENLKKNKISDLNRSSPNISCVRLVLDDKQSFMKIKDFKDKFTKNKIDESISMNYYVEPFDKSGNKYSVNDPGTMMKFDFDEYLMIETANTIYHIQIEHSENGKNHKSNLVEFLMRSWNVFGYDNKYLHELLTEKLQYDISNLEKIKPLSVFNIANPKFNKIYI